MNNARNYLPRILDQKKADGRGQMAEGIYPDANGTLHLATDKDQGFQAPTESISVASLD